MPRSHPFLVTCLAVLAGWAADQLWEKSRETATSAANPHRTGPNLRVARTQGSSPNAGVPALSVTPLQHALAPTKSHLATFSVQARVAPRRPLTVGIDCSPAAPVGVLLRAIGRGLPTGLGTPALPTPVLQLVRGERVIAEDVGSAIAPALAELARQTGAFPVAPVSPAAFSTYGSAIATRLDHGTHSIVIRSADAGSGSVLFELHPAGSPPLAPSIRRVSARGEVGAGAESLTAGFTIGGDSPLRLLVRGLGPGLAAVGRTGFVTDPRISVYGSSPNSLLARNDDWADTPAVTAATRRTQAAALDSGSRDAALVLTVSPGIYTAQLSVAGNTTGDAILEIYVVD